MSYCEYQSAYATTVVYDKNKVVASCRAEFFSLMKAWTVLKLQFALALKSNRNDKLQLILNYILRLVITSLQ